MVALLADLHGLVVIDEVQRRPELLPVLRVLVDRPKTDTRFLVLGSASPDLLRQTSETLAGRIEFVDLAEFRLDEVGPAQWRRLWLRGGFPRVFLAGSDAEHRFWSMVAHFHGQTWNSSDVARSLGVSDQTTRRYLDVLSAACLVRQLPPWFENVAKRQVKAPKVYVRDSGVLHRLLDITAAKALFAHPKCGASCNGSRSNTSCVDAKKPKATPGAHIPAPNLTYC